MDMNTVMTYLQIFAWLYLIGWITVLGATIWAVVYLVKRFWRRSTDGMA